MGRRLVAWAEASQLAKEVLRELAVEELLLHHVDPELPRTHSSMSAAGCGSCTSLAQGHTRALPSRYVTSSVQPSLMELRSSLRMKRCRDAGARQAGTV